MVQLLTSEPALAPGGAIHNVRSNIEQVRLVLEQQEGAGAAPLASLEGLAKVQELLDVQQMCPTPDTKYALAHALSNMALCDEISLEHIPAFMGQMASLLACGDAFASVLGWRPAEWRAVACEVLSLHRHAAEIVCRRKGPDHFDVVDGLRALALLWSLPVKLHEIVVHFDPSYRGSDWDSSTGAYYAPYRVAKAGNYSLDIYLLINGFLLTTTLVRHFRRTAQLDWSLFILKARARETRPRQR